jgi:hypothetical protein
MATVHALATLHLSRDPALNRITPRAQALARIIHPLNRAATQRLGHTAMSRPA